MIKAVHQEPADEAIKLSQWRLVIYTLLCLAGVFVVAYFDALNSIASTWISSQTYMHGMLVIPISFLLIYRNRVSMMRVFPEPSLIAIVLLLFLSFVWYIAAIAQVDTLSHLAVIAMLPLMICALIGVDSARRIAFPLVYMLFALPAGEFLVEPLQDFTASFAVAALQITGIPVFREGRLLSTPTGDWRVIDACSGIRYLIATLVLATLFSYFNFRSVAKRVVFIVLACLIAILANGLRAYGVIMAGHLSDMRWVQGDAHIIYGWFFYGLVIIALFWCASKVSDHGGSCSSDEDGADVVAIQNMKSRGRIVVMAVIILCALVAGPVAYSYSERRTMDALDNVSIEILDSSSEWNAVDKTLYNWMPGFEDASAVTSRNFSIDESSVDIHAAYYQFSNDGSKLVSAKSRIYDERRWHLLDEADIEVVMDGEWHFVRESVIKSEEDNFVIWMWYEIDGKILSKHWVARLYEIWGKITGANKGGLVMVVAAEYDVRPFEARNHLNAFLSSGSLSSVTISTEL